MKDSELRGIVLKTLYDNRHREMDFGFGDSPPLPDGIETRDWIRICNQLSEQGLIKWQQMIDPGQRRAGAGVAQISADGVDVIEGEAPAPVAIHVVDQRQTVNVTGSQSVQIAGHQSTQQQTLSDAFDKVVSAVNSANVGEDEKKQAKTILMKFLESKVAAAVLGPAVTVLIEKLSGH